MTRFALAPPWIAVLPFDLRYATPVRPVATGRQGSSSPRSLPKQTFNAPRQQTASDKIPITFDARPRHISRGFLPWRFAYAGPGVRRATIMGPASANLHTSRPRAKKRAAQRRPSRINATSLQLVGTSLVIAVLKRSLFDDWERAQWLYRGADDHAIVLPGPRNCLSGYLSFCS
jgi:hypothetical protein